MIKNFRRRYLHRGRKYPIKRDESGKSARRRAFERFEKGLGPAEVAPLVDVSKETARRYYQDWKKLPRKTRERYRVVHTLLKKNPEFSQRILKTASDMLDLPVGEVRRLIQRPWGLKQVTSAIDTKTKRIEWLRLRSTIKIIHMCEVSGIPLTRVLDELQKLEAEYKGKGRKGQSIR